MIHSVLCVAWKTSVVVLLAGGLLLLAQKGCVPEPDQKPRPAFRPQLAAAFEARDPANAETPCSRYA